MSRTDDSSRFYAGLFDLARRRIELIFNAHRTGPVYDPTYQGRDAGGGTTCSKCRKVSSYGVRVCGSCGTLLRMQP